MTQNSAACKTYAAGRQQVELGFNCLIDAFTQLTILTWEGGSYTDKLHCSRVMPLLQLYTSK